MPSEQRFFDVTRVARQAVSRVVRRGSGLKHAVHACVLPLRGLPRPVCAQRAISTLRRLQRRGA